MDPLMFRALVSASGTRAAHQKTSISSLVPLSRRRIPNANATCAAYIACSLSITAITCDEIRCRLSSLLRPHIAFFTLASCSTVYHEPVHGEDRREKPSHERHP
eukprot:7377159-Pyramimonas_sp.AAC.1